MNDGPVSMVLADWDDFDPLLGLLLQAGEV